MELIRGVARQKPVSTSHDPRVTLAPSPNPAKQVSYPPRGMADDIADRRVGRAKLQGIEGVDDLSE